MKTQTYVERDCTITYEDKTFESGGAVITDDYLIAYPSDKWTGDYQSLMPKYYGYAKTRVLCDWHGNVIGTWCIVSSRKAVFFGRESWQGSRYYFMRATLTDGRQYSLRGFGAGMIAKGKRIKGS